MVIQIQGTEEKEVLFTQKGTVRKRKPKQPINYFTEDTEKAILEYLTSTDQAERNKIYETRIQYAFYKLTQNIINTFKFFYLNEGGTIEDLQHECTVFLLEKLSKFKPDKGKAYSYFGTICKRYLIFQNNKAYKAFKSRAEVDEIDNDKTILSGLENEDESPVNLTEFLDYYTKFLEDNLFTLFKKEGEQKVADAVIQLFKNRASLDVLSKKSIYIYIREMTDEDTPVVTRVIKKLKDIYREKLSFFLDNDYYDSNIS